MNLGKRAMTIAIAAAGALGFAVVAPATALASNGPGTVTAVTHAADHPDTTSVSGPATLSGFAGGPVWAFDNLAIRFAVTPEAGPGDYSVTITYSGTFAAFADPRTGDAWIGNGSVRGTLQYDISSVNAPDPAALPAQEPGGLDGASTGDMLDQLFGGSVSYVGGGSYHFTYTMVNGSVYVQNG